MSAENPATLANVPINRNSGTVASSALERTPVGSLTRGVLAGPQPDCSAKPTTPTMIMAKPIGTCTSISANSARMPKPPISSGLILARAASVLHPLGCGRRAEQITEIECDDDELH